LKGTDRQLSNIHGGRLKVISSYTSKCFQARKNFPENKSLPYPEVAKSAAF